LKVWQFAPYFAMRPAMTTSEAFRANAAAERAAAAKTNLPNRKAMHERSAMTWDAMAQGVEETAERASVNLAAKTAAAR
jgi:hypothetical protein